MIFWFLNLMQDSDYACSCSVLPSFITFFFSPLDVLLNFMELNIASLSALSLGSEKPRSGHLSWFCLQASPSVLCDLVTWLYIYIKPDSRFYIQSLFFTRWPGLHWPLLLKAVLARDSGSDLISHSHSAPLKPAPPSLSMGFLLGE